MPNFLIIGSGAREHALAWKIATERSRFGYCYGANTWVAPGNPGIESENKRILGCFPLEDPDADPSKSPYEQMLEIILERVKYHLIDCIVIGPEAPLAEGLVDDLKANGIAVFGPTKSAAQLETSKTFAKEVMRAAGVKTAAYEVFNNADDALAYLEKASHPIVIKADGLAAGKGVFVSQSLEESRAAIDTIFNEKRFGDAGNSVIIEEFLEGPELSFMVLTNGDQIVDLPTSRDHKRLLDGDKGPNTGGMGAVSPVEPPSEEFSTKIKETIFRPVLDELKKRGINYLGFLYAGLILTEDGPYVLEFNVRMGDPETQSILFGMAPPIGPVIFDMAHDLVDCFPPPESLAPEARPTCSVVMASPSYPTATKDEPVQIEGLSEIQLEDEDIKVFFSSVTANTEIPPYDRTGKRCYHYCKYPYPPFYSNGGRVLTVTARADDLETARKKVYDAIEKISFKGAHYRKDIGE